MQNNLSKLISDCDQLKKTAKVSFHCALEESLVNVSETLGVILPEDFKELSLKVSHASFPLIDFFLMYKEQDNPNGIIMNNLDLREEFAKYSNSKSDMSHILVLADGDGGSVFMITKDSPEKPTPIIWCDYGDMYYYSIHKKFQYPHDEWPSFTAFFEYLVEREEEALKEDGREAE